MILPAQVPNLFNTYRCILCEGLFSEYNRDKHLMEGHNYQPVHVDIASILDDMFLKETHEIQILGNKFYNTK